MRRDDPGGTGPPIPAVGRRAGGAFTTADVTDVITHRGLRITFAVAEGITRRMMASKRRPGGNGNRSNLQLVIAFDCGGRRLHPWRSGTARFSLGGPCLALLWKVLGRVGEWQ